MNRLALALAAILSLAAAATAQTQIYVAEYAFEAAEIRTMNADGSNPHTLFSLPAADWLPLGMTFDAATQRLIWMDSAGGSEIHAANLNGTGATIIGAVPGFARGVAVDSAGRLYFATDNTIGRINADGTGLFTLFTSPTDEPTSPPAVDRVNGHVYFGAVGYIMRIDLDGQNPKIIFRGADHPNSVVVDSIAGYVYWIDAQTETDFVAKVRLDGSGFQILADMSPGVGNQSFLTGLALDATGQKLYFCDEIPGMVYTVGTDGTGFASLYASSKSPSGISVSVGEPPQAVRDCNGNGIPDTADIAGGAPDCDANGTIDFCQAGTDCDRVFLLDNGSNAASPNGRAIGVPSQWEIFQPFLVPAGGWMIGEIGLDGNTVVHVHGVQEGLTVSLYPDDGTTTRPNETASIASAHVSLTFNTVQENWAYGSLSAALAPGQYWVGIRANDPVGYWGSMNLGLSGLQSRSRGSSGSFGSPAPAVAVRIVQGNSCRADFNNSGALTVQDIFDFLAGWFGGDPRADFNGGGLSVQDIFDFLAAWFAGCP